MVLISYTLATYQQELSAQIHVETQQCLYRCILRLRILVSSCIPIHAINVGNNDARPKPHQIIHEILGCVSCAESAWDSLERWGFFFCEREEYINQTRRIYCPIYCPICGTGPWRKRYSRELEELYNGPNIFHVIKSGRPRWADDFVLLDRNAGPSGRAV